MRCIPHCTHHHVDVLEWGDCGRPLGPLQLCKRITNPMGAIQSWIMGTDDNDGNGNSSARLSQRSRLPPLTMGSGTTTAASHTESGFGRSIEMIDAELEWGPTWMTSNDSMKQISVRRRGRQMVLSEAVRILYFDILTMVVHAAGPDQLHSASITAQYQLNEPRGVGAWVRRATLTLHTGGDERTPRAVVRLDKSEMELVIDQHEMLDAYQRRLIS